MAKPLSPVEGDKGCRKEVGPFVVSGVCRVGGDWGRRGRDSRTRRGKSTSKSISSYFWMTHDSWGDPHDYP